MKGMNIHMITPAYESFVNDICMEADNKNTSKEFVYKIKNLIGKFTEFVKAVISRVSNSVTKVVGSFIANISSKRAEKNAKSNAFKELTNSQYDSLNNLKGAFCAANMFNLQAGLAKAFKKYINYQSDSLGRDTVSPGTNADMYNMQINEVIQQANDPKENSNAINNIGFISRTQQIDLKGYAAFAKKYCNDLKTGSKQITDISNKHLLIITANSAVISYPLYRSSMQIESYMFSQSSAIIRQSMQFFTGINHLISGKELKDSENDQNKHELDKSRLLTA